MTKLTKQQIDQKVQQSINIELLPKQKKFLYQVLQNEKVKYTWYVWWFWSWKSFIWSYTSIILALLYPKNSWLIARNTLKNLKRTTQKTFFNILENVIWLKPNTWARTFNKGDQVIKFYNWSEIYFTGLDDIDKLKSLELGFFYIDEVDEVSWEVLMIAQGRLRNPYVPRRIGFITSNSEWKNWAYSLFIKWLTPTGAYLTDKEREYYYTLRASSLENKYLPTDYVESLLQYKWDQFKKYVLWSFDIFEWQIFNEFSVDRNVIQPFQIPYDRPVYYWLDYWIADPFVFIEVRHSPDNKLYITWLHYLSGAPVKTHVEVLKRRIQQMQFTSYDIIADPSIFNVNQQPTPNKPFPFAISDEIRDYWIYPIPWNNSILAGVNRMKQMFEDCELLVFEWLDNLIDELQAYKRKKNSLWITENKPSPKCEEHAIDALRYVVMQKAPPPMLTNNKPINEIQQDILNLNNRNNGISTYTD